MTLQQRLKAAQNIKQTRQVHEYYMATPGCTIRRAAAFLPNIPITMIYQYSKFRTECLDVINATIDMRYWHRGAQGTKEV